MYMYLYVPIFNTRRFFSNVIYLSFYAAVWKVCTAAVD